MDSISKLVQQMLHRAKSILERVKGTNAENECLKAFGDFVTGTTCFSDIRDYPGLDQYLALKSDNWGDLLSELKKEPLQHIVCVSPSCVLPCKST